MANDIKTAQVKSHFGPPFTWSIVVFALLMMSSLSFPAITHQPSRTMRRTAAARNDAGQLVAALQLYEGEFHHLPASHHAEILRELWGDNSLNIVFYEPKPKQISHAEELLDPWVAVSWLNQSARWHQTRPRFWLGALIPSSIS